jgi:hypothetical protein
MALVERFGPELCRVYRDASRVTWQFEDDDDYEDDFFNKSHNLTHNL